VLRDIDTADDLAAVAELVDVPWPTTVRELLDARADRRPSVASTYGVASTSPAGGAFAVTGAPSMESVPRW